MTFRMTSSAFAEGGAVPRKATCDGENVSPDLEWTDAPPETAAFALIVDDPDANGFTHWIVYNMTGSATGALPEGVSESPDAPPQGINDFDKLGYGGPCPPSGEHHYRFTLHALDDVLAIAQPPRVEELRAALAGRVLATAVLSATYGRG